MLEYKDHTVVLETPPRATPESSLSTFVLFFTLSSLIIHSALPRNPSLQLQQFTTDDIPREGWLYGISHPTYRVVPTCPGLLSSHQSVLLVSPGCTCIEIWFDTRSATQIDRMGLRVPIGSSPGSGSCRRRVVPQLIIT